MAGQSSKLFCGICFDFKPESDMFIRSKCNHPFCTDCISNYVATQIQKNVVNVNCPNPNCSIELKPKHLQPIMPKEVIDRWESARYESSTVGLQKTYCPFKDCSVLLVNDGNVVTSSECTSCHRLFCMQCKVPWHAGMDCKEFQKLKRSEREKELDLMFCELAKLKMWQKCPTCSIYVESCGGCEHITCVDATSATSVGRIGSLDIYAVVLGPHEISQMAEQSEAQMTNMKEVLAIIYHKERKSGS